MYLVRELEWSNCACVMWPFGNCDSTMAEVVALLMGLHSSDGFVGTETVKSLWLFGGEEFYGGIWVYLPVRGILST